MKARVLILTAIACLSAFAAQARSAACDGVIAQEVLQDPFFKTRLMSQGKYEGECLANEKRRDIVLVSAKNSAARKVIPRFNQKNIYFANFRHQNKYYIAEYEPESIAETYLFFEKFIEGGLPRILGGGELRASQLVFTGHIQLRFKLKKGRVLKLYDQNAARPVVKPIEINDFSYAMYAIRPESLLGTTYEPFGEGIKGGYALSHNFLSTHDVALEYKSYVDPAKARVGQYLLERSAFNAEKALQALLKQSDGLYRAQDIEVYHTISNNCVTATYTGIVAGDKGIGKSHPRWYRLYSRHLIANVTDGREYNPMSVFSDLERRKILKDRNQSQLNDFNDEICSLIKCQN